MRLFLSSENFGKYPEKLVELVGRNKRVAYIGNAKDYLSETDRRDKVVEHCNQFLSLDFEFVEFDLRDYFTDPEKLKKEFTRFGLVWISGGNTFLLNSALKQSGMDKLLIEKICSDEIAYGGSSAGAIIATPSLRGSELGDNPGMVKILYGKDVVWQALNLVPYYIVPHYDNEWFGDESKAMAAYFDKKRWEYIILRDGQVQYVNGDKSELLV